jgi:hypothetical protein
MLPSYSTVCFTTRASSRSKSIAPTPTALPRSTSPPSPCWARASVGSSTSASSGSIPTATLGELRRRIRRGLLKVEQLHALARDVFYGRRGRIKRLRAVGADEHLHLPESDPGVHRLRANRFARSAEVADVVTFAPRLLIGRRAKRASNKMGGLATARNSSFKSERPIAESVAISFLIRDVKSSISTYRCIGV